MIYELRKAQEAIERAIKICEQSESAIAFRACVEDLLLGTPYEKPDNHDVEGLYGRLRNVVTVGLKHTKGA